MPGTLVNLCQGPLQGGTESSPNLFAALVTPSAQGMTEMQHQTQSFHTGSVTFGSTELL